jgi:hypothetical protein
MSTSPKLLTGADAARVIGCSKASVSRAHQAGVITPVATSLKGYPLFSPEHIAAWLARRTPTSQK